MNTLPEYEGAAGEPEAVIKDVIDLTLEDDDDEDDVNNKTPVTEEEIAGKVSPLPEETEAHEIHDEFHDETTPKLFELTDEEFNDLEKNDIIIQRNVIESIDTDDEDDMDDMFIDESLMERLWGLTEMFPSGLRNATHSSLHNTISLTTTVLGLAKSGVWVAATSFAILALPVLFESERSQVEQQQLAQQRQILLGPSAAGNALQPTTSMMPPTS